MTVLSKAVSFTGGALKDVPPTRGAKKAVPFTGGATKDVPFTGGACINTGAHCGAVKSYEPERNELLVNVADRDSASMPTARTVSESNTLIIPCATNQLVTTSGVANKQLVDEIYHHVIPHQ